jgi:hypothetical protein
MAFLSANKYSFRERAAYYGYLFYLFAIGTGLTYASVYSGVYLPLIGPGLLIPALLVFSLATPTLIPLAWPATSVVIICVWLGLRKQRMALVIVGYSVGTLWWIYLVHLSLHIPKPG